VDGDDGEPGVALAGGERVEGVLIHADEFLLAENDGGFAAEFGDGFVEGGASAAWVLASGVLFDEEAWFCGGDLIFPGGDVLIVFDCDAMSGIEVEEEAVLGKLVGEAGGGEEDAEEKRFHGGLKCVCGVRKDASRSIV
jgi:hypothetical protein